MKANERHKEDRDKYDDAVQINKKTMDRYKQSAEIASRKKQLAQSKE